MEYYRENDYKINWRQERRKNQAENKRFQGTLENEGVKDSRDMTVIMVFWVHPVGNQFRKCFLMLMGILWSRKWSQCTDRS